MASIRLVVNPATPHGKMLAEAVDNLYDAMQKIDRINGMMGMAVRSQAPLVDADFHPLCTELGMDFTKPADLAMVKDLFYLVAIVKTQLAAAELVAFVQQCDQG